MKDFGLLLKNNIHSKKSNEEHREINRACLRRINKIDLWKALLML